jgi:hypothetical protein
MIGLRIPALRMVPVLAAAACFAACGSSAITRARIESAVASTFANLVQVQLERMGLGRVPPPGIRAAATCRRMTPGRGEAGSGEWACALTWYGPNRRPLVDAYDVMVAADGCYTASVGAGEGNLGGPTIPATNGTRIRNVLYAFDGCLDSRTR